MSFTEDPIERSALRAFVAFYEQRNRDARDQLEGVSSRAASDLIRGRIEGEEAVISALRSRFIDDTPERMSKPDRIRIDRGEYRRASGMAKCDVCEECYIDHPSVEGARWLTRACDGRLLKL